MTFLVETLRPLLAHGVMHAKAADAKSFQATLLEKRRGFFVQCSDGHWTLDFCDKKRLAGYLVYDSNRMGCAAFQTFETARVGMKETHRMPWALIQAYYAAYYAGHSVLCAFGRNSKHLDGALVSFLNKVFSAQSLPHMSSGLYFVTAEQSGTGLKLEPLSAGAVKGGAHERFWEAFDGEIRRLGSDVLKVSAPQVDAQGVSSKLADLLFAMAGPKKSKSWLSQVRNEVQYRHERDVWWHAKSNRRPDPSVLSGIMDGCREDPMGVELRSPPDELQRFVASCTFLVSLCRALLEDVSKFGKFRPPALAFPPL